MARAVPQLAIDFIEKVEAIEFVSYQDSKGVWTIGAGHTGPDIVEGLTWTYAQVMSALAADLAEAAGHLGDVVSTTEIGMLTDHEYAALISFVFNLGANPDWTIWKVLNAGALDQVPTQLARFTKVRLKSGRVVEIPGLRNRRAAEIALWSTGDVMGSAKIALAAPVAPPPSSQTRVADTPPLPLPSAKPAIQSKTVWAGGATTAAGGVAAATQVQQLAGDHGGHNELMAKIVVVCVVIIVVLGIAIMLFRSIDEKRKHK